MVKCCASKLVVWRKAAGSGFIYVLSNPVACFDVQGFTGFCFFISDKNFKKSVSILLFATYFQNSVCCITPAEESGAILLVHLERRWLESIND